MAESSTVTEAPVAEDAFLADRQRFLASFTAFTFWAVVGVLLILILLALVLL
jgi:hypothetical protein